MKSDSIQDYARALYEATKDASDSEREKIIAAFVELLFKAGKLKFAPKIIETFIKLNKKITGIVDITVTTAQTIDEETLAHIMKAFGSKVEAVMLVNPAMIGGVKIRTENTILDGSIRTQLTLLKQQLI